MCLVLFTLSGLVGVAVYVRLVTVVVYCDLDAFGFAIDCGVYLVGC